MIRHGALRVVTAATDLAVSVADAKAFCIIETDEFDALIEGFIRVAHDWLQPPVGWLGRTLMQQTVRADLKVFPHGPLPLPAPPIVSIASVKYLDQLNQERTLDPALYFLDEDTLCWADAFSPPALYWRPGAVRITYVAGYENAAALPTLARQAILMLVAHWFENREAVSVAGALNVMPIGVQDLLSPLRLY